MATALIRTIEQKMGLQPGAVFCLVNLIRGGGAIPELPEWYVSLRQGSNLEKLKADHVAQYEHCLVPK